MAQICIKYGANLRLLTIFYILVLWLDYKILIYEEGDKISYITEKKLQYRFFVATCAGYGFCVLFIFFRLHGYKVHKNCKFYNILFPNSLLIDLYFISICFWSSENQWTQNVMSSIACTSFYQFYIAEIRFFYEVYVRIIFERFLEKNIDNIKLCLFTLLLLIVFIAFSVFCIWFYIEKIIPSPPPEDTSLRDFILERPNGGLYHWDQVSKTCLKKEVKYKPIIMKECTSICPVRKLIYQLSYKRIEVANKHKCEMLNNEIYLHEMEDVELFCTHSFYFDEFDLVTDIVWKKDDEAVVTSPNLNIKLSLYEDGHNHVLTDESRVEIYLLNASNFGRYSCFHQRFYYIPGMQNIYVETTLIKTYSLNRVKRPSHEHIQIPIGRSMYLQYYPLYILANEEDIEIDYYINNVHIVDLISHSEDQCTEYGKRFLDEPVGVVKLTNIDGHYFIGIYLCTYPPICGTHHLVIYRRFYNAVTHKSEIHQLRHPLTVTVSENTSWFLPEPKNMSDPLIMHGFGDYLVEFLRYCDYCALSAQYILELGIKYFIIIIILYFTCMAVVPVLIIHYFVFTRGNKMVDRVIKEYIDEVLGPNNNDLKRFDLTFLYSEEDHIFVKKKFVKPLQKATELKICHREHLDMRAGMQYSEIYDEITKKSDKYVIYLTKKFQEDEECKFYQLECVIVGGLKNGIISPTDVIIINDGGKELMDEMNICIQNIEIFYIKNVNIEDCLHRIKQFALEDDYYDPQKYAYTA